MIFKTHTTTPPLQIALIMGAFPPTD